MKNSSEKKLNIILVLTHLLYISLAIFEIIWLALKGINIDGIVWLAISGVAYSIPFMSIFIPKKIHHILYKFGWAIFRKTETNAQIEPDSYKSFKKICVMIVAVAIAFVIIGICLTLFA